MFFSSDEMDMDSHSELDPTILSSQDPEAFKLLEIHLLNSKSLSKCLYISGSSEDKILASSSE